MIQQKLYSEIEIFDVDRKNFYKNRFVVLMTSVMRL